MKSKRGKLGLGMVAEKNWPCRIACGVHHNKYQRGIYVAFEGLLGRLELSYLHCNKFDPAQGHFAIGVLT